MKELQIKLENCFGIGKLDKTFDFSQQGGTGAKRTVLIYARNGEIKTLNKVNLMTPEQYT